MIDSPQHRLALMKVFFYSLLTLFTITPSMAVILSPQTDYFEDHLSLGGNLNYQPALDALRNNDFQTAVDLARGYVARTPTDANAHLLLVLGWIGLGDKAAMQIHLGELKAGRPKLFTFISHEIAIYYANQRRYYKSLHYLNGIAEDDVTGNMLRLRGEVQEIQGDMKGSIKSYEALLDQEAEARDALLALARLYLVEGDAHKSLSYSQRLGRTGTDLPVLRVLTGTASMMLGDANVAMASFEKAVALDDQEVIAWNQLGALNLLAENYPAALVAYQRANAAKGLNESKIGVAYASLYIGDADSAIAAISKIDSRNSLALMTVAAAHLSKGDSVKANAAYQQDAGIFIDFGMPGFDMGKYTSGDIATMATLLAFANDLYRQGYFSLNIKLMEKHPDLLNSSAFLGLTYARSLWKAGNQAKALSTYASIHKQYPQLAAPVVETADIAFHSGDMDTALSGYQQAVKLHPESLNLRARLASLYNQLNRPDDAIKEFETGLKSAPQSVYLLDQLASTYLQKLNKPEDALRYVEKAHALEANNPDVNNTLAATYYALGQYEKAAELYLELNKLNIANPAFYYDTGMSLLKVKKNDLAASAFERVLDAGPAFEQYPAAEAQYKSLTIAHE